MRWCPSASAGVSGGAAPVGRPAYQRVADDLRQQIAAGELAVGSAIPSTARLTRAYGVSYTVIRAAIGELRIAGLVFGQPGKGVFVRATPDDVAEQTSTIDDLAAQVAELREMCGRESAVPPGACLTAIQHGDRWSNAFSRQLGHESCSRRSPGTW